HQRGTASMISDGSSGTSGASSSASARARTGPALGGRGARAGGGARLPSSGATTMSRQAASATIASVRPTAAEAAASASPSRPAGRLQQAIMTRQADFKRRVRARMAKTGESYAAARARLLAGGGARSALHVTNGDSAAGTLLETSLVERVLPWLDVLPDGPVPAVGDDELRRIRARFL